MRSKDEETTLLILILVAAVLVLRSLGSDPRDVDQSKQPPPAVVEPITPEQQAFQEAVSDVFLTALLTGLAGTLSFIGFHVWVATSIFAPGSRPDWRWWAAALLGVLLVFVPPCAVVATFAAPVWITFVVIWCFLSVVTMAVAIPAEYRQYRRHPQAN